MRDAVDVAKRVLTKEKVGRQLSGQTGETTPFMKVGGVHHSNRKSVSFSTQYLIREQLDNLISMVYHSPWKGKEIIDHLSPKYIKREREAKTEKTLENEIEIDDLVGIEQTVDKTLDLAIEDNCRTVKQGFLGGWIPFHLLGQP